MVRMFQVSLVQADLREAEFLTPKRIAQLIESQTLDRCASTERNE